MTILTSSSAILLHSTASRFTLLFRSLRSILTLKQFFFNPIAYGGGGGGGSFLARIIRLAARTLEAFQKESPKFLTSFLCLWRHCGEISSKLIFQGGGGGGGVAAVISPNKRS